MANVYSPKQRAKILAMRKLRDAQADQREQARTGQKRFGASRTNSALADAQRADMLEDVFNCVACGKKVDLDAGQRHGVLTILELAVIDPSLEPDPEFPSRGYGIEREHYDVSGDNLYTAGVCGPCVDRFRENRAETAVPPDVFRADEEFK